MDAGLIEVISSLDSPGLSPDKKDMIYRGLVEALPACSQNRHFISELAERPFLLKTVLSRFDSISSDPSKCDSVAVFLANVLSEAAVCWAPELLSLVWALVSETGMLGPSAYTTCLIINLIHASLDVLPPQLLNGHLERIFTEQVLRGLVESDSDDNTWSLLRSICVCPAVAKTTLELVSSRHFYQMVENPRRIAFLGLLKNCLFHQTEAVDTKLLQSGVLALYMTILLALPSSLQDLREDEWQDCEESFSIRALREKALLLGLADMPDSLSMVSLVVEGLLVGCSASKPLRLLMKSCHIYPVVREAHSALPSSREGETSELDENFHSLVQLLLRDEEKGDAPGA